MEDISPERISNLITSKLRGTISVVDDALLDRWLQQSDERRKLFKEISENYDYEKLLSIGYFSHKKFMKRGVKLLGERLPEFAAYQKTERRNNTKKYISTGLLLLILMALLAALFIYPGWI